MSATSILATLDWRAMYFLLRIQYFHSHLDAAQTAELLGLEDEDAEEALNVALAMWNWPVYKLDGRTLH